ncbi:hypothetical protein TTRE_0000707601 [Trichuris trichiura]|uniref:Uncharacterized protein n=1 Tax=Trichuris trichiura TaxID=36087 RepID=A0A077ZEI3_TRITR|nr:hypothetical protein TTRE_0000707601 [Trichuris trichiura]
MSERSLKPTHFNRKSNWNVSSMNRIDWDFNLPGGPHHDGAWERLIAVAKKALSATFCENIVDDEMMLTVFAEMETLLNGRSLTYLTEGHDCVEPQTPFCLLMGCKNVQIPSDVVE